MQKKKTQFERKKKPLVVSATQWKLSRFITKAACVYWHGDGKTSHLIVSISKGTKTLPGPLSFFLLWLVLSQKAATSVVHGNTHVGQEANDLLSGAFYCVNGVFCLCHLELIDFEGVIF